MLLDWYKIVLYHPKIANLNHGNTINMMMILTKNPFIFIDHHAIVYIEYWKNYSIFGSIFYLLFYLLQPYSLFDIKISCILYICMLILGLCNKDKYKDEWVSGWVVELIFICGVWYGSRLSLLGIGIDKYKWIWDLQ